jgi:hypothetical protein
VYGKSELNHRSNDELARLLYQRDNRAPPVARPQAPPPAPDDALASRRQPYDSADHSWVLAVSESSADQPITDRERRALFAALSRGTKANIGREPAVSELVLLVEEVNKARALASSARDAIQGTLSVYIRDGNLIFREPNGHSLEPARVIKGSTNVA